VAIRIEDEAEAWAHANASLHLESRDSCHDLIGEDDAVVAARAAVDPASFAPLYARYVRPIYRYCYRRLGSHEAAEDTTSQTFLKALGAIARFEDRRDGSFRSWIFTIADRAVTDAYRRRRPQTDLADAAEMIDAGSGPEALALAGEERRRVQSLLEALPDEQRRVVALRLAGLTGPEIAQVLSRHPAAVKSTQFRAYARLRRLLGREELS